MLGTILAAVIAILFGLWLVCSAFGILIQVLGVVLIIAGAVWVLRGLGSRNGTGV